ncbi:hypothetical protein [Listeria booriae]|uniref:hypothetical protein n=1 Tax=Listeria booriae TaxID=1552123 RepID=UPI001624192A|nr:hypothetical protein [Listeria booriae]MBC1524472.1 hypothetical protein [Listeria booriae]MBC6306450.1 hypothetical protein [Listeria booriae]
MKKSHWIVLTILFVICISVFSVFYFTTDNAISSKDMEGVQLNMTTDQVSSELGTPYKKIKTKDEIKDNIENLRDDPLSKYVNDDIDALLFDFENSSNSEVYLYKEKNSDEYYKLFFIHNKLAYF